MKNSKSDCHDDNSFKKLRKNIYKVSVIYFLRKIWKI